MPATSEIPITPLSPEQAGGSFPGAIDQEYGANPRVAASVAV